MNTCYFVVALLSIAAALVMSAEQTQECQCDEGSTVSLTFFKNASIAKGACGHLTLDSCKLTILCNTTSEFTLVSDKSLEIVCSNNSKAALNTSDNRLVNISLECSDNSEAHLEDGASNTLVLRIGPVCANNSNATSPTTTQSTPPQTTNEARTTESSNTNNNTAEVGTSNKPTVTSEYPNYSYNSNVTRSSNSSYDTTEEVPSGNITTTTTATTQKPETTTSYAVSLRICSGLVVMMLAVSSLL